MSSSFELKLADFGLGNAVEDENDLLKTECGTRSYMAPGYFPHLLASCHELTHIAACRDNGSQWVLWCKR